MLAIPFGGSPTLQRRPQPTSNRHVKLTTRRSLLSNQHDSLFDLLVGVRLGDARPPISIDEKSISEDPGLAQAAELAAELQALHFPTAFPEVFLRDRPGFDCILGNPPWEEVKFEQRDFFTLRNPGVRSLTQAEYQRFIQDIEAGRPDLISECASAAEHIEMMKRTLMSGPYPGMGSGDPDLYKAFCWRFWHLVRQDGFIGVVLPRSALSAAGSAPWRTEVLDHGAFTDVTMILNNSQWFFEMSILNTPLAS